jgi:hypothetical protein
VSRLCIRDLRRSCSLRDRGFLSIPSVSSPSDLNRVCYKPSLCRRKPSSSSPSYSHYTIYRQSHETLASLSRLEDGTKIWADAVGDPSKPSVVFIPGASSSTLIFDKQFEDPELTKNLLLGTTSVIHSEVLADAGVKVRYDVRGQGLSDQPLDPSAWTSNKFAEDFKAVVEAFGLKKPFIAAWYVALSCNFKIARVLMIFP